MTAQSGERFEEFPTPPNGLRMPVHTPPNGGASPRAIAVFACVAGLVVGAAVASGIWLLFGNGGPSSSPVSAPARLGDYYRFPDVPELSSGDAQRTTVERQERYDRENSARLSQAHDGAGAVVQQYANADLDEMFSLEVVRAPSPFPPYVPFTDPEDLGVDKPIEEVLRYGAVACAVRNDPGQPPRVMACTRSADDLTVSITHVTADIDPEDVAALVDDAWSEVS
ncbi:hypothetical protein [Actinophytocola sp. KF-1]